MKKLSPFLVVLGLLSVVQSAKAGEPGTTRGIIDISKQERPADAVTLVGPDGYTLVPEGKEPTQWIFKDGILTASPVWDSVHTKETYQDFRMHVEFNVNEVKDAKDPEADGNSGIYIQQRYEIQILNSFGVTAADYKPSYCGSMYRQKKPDRLVCKKAGEWQSYDIAFRAARFEGDRKSENARITVYQNGELIHDDYSITGKTGVGEKEGPEPRPIKLQGHHNPVRFRNVWIQRLSLMAPAAKSDKTILTSEGWNLEACGDDGRITIKHERLGMLLRDVRLNLEADGAVRELKQWSVEICGPQSQQASSSASESKKWTPESGIPGRLLVRTVEPLSTWSFEPTRDCLKISSTAPGALLTGQAPVSKARQVARLLDSEGAPVIWQGTGECAGTYGGGFTRNGSFLPRENPECMYFTLGQASGSVFHSLFDQKTDTAVRFTPQTRFAAGGTDMEHLGFTMPLPGPGLIRLVPDYYTKVLGLPHYAPMDTSVFDQAPTTWCSWASYFGDVTEDAIVTNTDWIAEHLKPYGFQYVQIDDGYDRIPGKWGKAGHNWIDQWDKDRFPKGPEWIAKYIKSQGLRPGLWLVPNAYSGAVETHPDWYLRDKQGGFIRDYNTPSLDSSNPEVLNFLKELFGTLGGWGFEYYKFDGEFSLPAYAPRVDVTRLHDRTTDPVEIYRKRLAVIREAIGPKIFVEGCPSGTPLNGIGYFNSYFNGQDVYNNWQGMHALLDSINANAFLNRMVVYVMPDGVELGETISIEEAKRKRAPNVVINASQREDPMIGLGVTLPEARTLVSMVALSGVAYSLTGVMPELPPDRLPLLQRTLPTMPIAPLDLFSRGTESDWAQFRHVRADDYLHNYPEILDLKVAAKSGTYDVVALPNWRSAPVTKVLSLSRQLGLDSGEKYVVFDFWNQALLGVVADRLSVKIEGHDTRVLLVHRLLNRPQLIGTSRHITGAYSIQDLSWDAGENTLHGRSEVVPGAEYTLFIHVPANTFATSSPTATSRGSQLQIRQERIGDLLSVRFNSPVSPVTWHVKF